MIMIVKPVHETVLIAQELCVSTPASLIKVDDFFKAPEERNKIK